MKKIIQFIVIIIATVCCISACKKGMDIKTSTEVKFSDEGLSWIQLPLNKYFIFKDSATGTLDSVVVTQSNLERKFQPPYNYNGLNQPEYYYETFSLNLSKYIATNAQDWFYGTAVASNLGFFGSVSSTDLANVILFEKDRSTNTEKNCVFASSGYIVTNTNQYASFDVLGKNYSNVRSFTTANGSGQTNPNYLKTTYYWAKGVGIIKREIITNISTKTESLVRNG